MKERLGYVYFIEAAGSGFVKIGWTCFQPSSAKRLKEMQTSCPHELVLLGFARASRTTRGHSTSSSPRCTTGASGSGLSLSCAGT